jgi:hypothetical protein
MQASLYHFLCQQLLRAFSAGLRLFSLSHLTLNHKSQGAYFGTRHRPPWADSRLIFGVYKLTRCECASGRHGIGKELLVWLNMAVTRKFNKSINGEGALNFLRSRSLSSILFTTEIWAISITYPTGAHSKWDSTTLRPFSWAHSLLPRVSTLYWFLGITQ